MVTTVVLAAAVAFPVGMEVKAAVPIAPPQAALTVVVVPEAVAGAGMGGIRRLDRGRRCRGTVQGGAAVAGAA